MRYYLMGLSDVQGEVVLLGATWDLKTIVQWAYSFDTDRLLAVDTVEGIVDANKLLRQVRHIIKEEMDDIEAGLYVLDDERKQEAVNFITTAIEMRRLYTGKV